MKRNKFIGGSDVAAILGIDRYRTPYEVWDEKKNGNNPFTGNQFTEWGILLEPVIITKFEKENGVTVRDNNKTFIHPEYPFLGCHPDGIYGADNDLLEVKTVGSNAYKHWGNDIPLEYYCQIIHNMDVTGAKKGKFVYLVLDDRFYDEIKVNYDAEFAKKQRDHLIDWWKRYIIGNEIPTKVVADYEKSTPEQAIIEADNEAFDTYNELVGIKAKIKELTSLKEDCEIILKEKIGDNTELMHGLDTLATWKPSVRVTVSTKKLKEEQPELFLKYAEEKHYRTFLIKQPKN